MLRCMPHNVLVALSIIVDSHHIEAFVESSSNVGLVVPMHSDTHGQVSICVVDKLSSLRSDLEILKSHLSREIVRKYLTCDISNLKTWLSLF